MAMTTAFKNLILDAGAAVITHIGLMDGSSEISGGNPAYARKAVYWGPASNGVVRPTSDLTFDVPAGATVTAWAGFTASTGGTNYGGASLTAETFAGQGQYKLLAAGTGIRVDDPT